MTIALAELEVLVVDCQAGGATPEHGDLLEIAWAVCGAQGVRGSIQEHYVVPRSDRRVPGAVRELTGWSEACVAHALSEGEVWSRLCADIARVAAQSEALERAVAAIHYARFELAFLRDLHERLGGPRSFPLDTVCLHAIAARLLPDLPRRNIRALSGYLGHSPELLRRSGSHVEASAFIWRALVPRLEQAGVVTLDALEAWLARPAPRRARGRRVYPFGAERRRALPDRPGVYRFVRKSGDVLYVGKAASVKKRVASHFVGRGKPSERVLELLTQVQDVRVSETASALEAALLECDEIKRLDPPYNVQLRGGERSAWFAARDLAEANEAPDADHPLGPLPSRRALSALPALVALAGGEQATPALAACALAVPIAALPQPELFAEGFATFAAAHLGAPTGSARRRVDRAARALWLQRGRSEPEVVDDAPPDGWDKARVKRRLERSLVQTGLLLRRARWLCLLANADVVFRERGMTRASCLSLSGGEVMERRELASVAALDELPARAMPARFERQRSFDAARYDRMRVLATELNRIHAEGAELALRFGARRIEGERLAGLLRWV